MAVAPPINAQFQTVEERIETFRHWPSSAALTADRIARAGFYYTGNGTEVECFACKKRISDWNPNDQAIARHKSLNPNCPFVKLRSRTFRSQPPRSLPRTLSTASGSSRSSDSDSPPSSSPSSPPGETRTLWMNPSRPILSDSDRQALKREDVRLATFSGRWTVSFIEPRELAKAGFFFVGHEDQVQCAFCAGVIGHWENGDDPAEEHRRHFGICPFICGAEVGNVPVEATSDNETPSLNLPPPFPGGYDICERYYRTRSRPLTDNVAVLRGLLSNQPSIDSPGSLASLGINEHRGPEHPDKTTYEARLKTFSNWHYYDRQKPEKLAEAGFFYLGQSDKVKCFHCDMGLCNWEPNDEPWFEHAKWSSKCIYVMQTRGENYVKHVYESARNKKVKDDVTNERKLEERVRIEMESPITKTALEVVEAYKVRQAILNEIRKNGRGFTTPDSLIIAALEIPDDMVGMSEPFSSASSFASAAVGVDIPPQSHRLVGNASANVEAPVLLVSGCVDVTSRSESPPGGETMAVAPSPVAMEMCPDMPPSPKSVPSDEAMEEGSIEKAIEERYKCKVCLDRQIEVIFLPCGHLASCTSCAPALPKCPLCRTVIRGTAKAFLP